MGDHIDQKGSLVSPEKLRFDFSHKAQIALQQLTIIENTSIQWIKKNVPVFSRELDLQTAHKIPGVRAVFGEAYPDPVRVVTLEHDAKDIAQDIANSKWRQTSIEFCGGTLVVFTHCYTLANVRQGTSPKLVISKISSSQKRVELPKALEELSP